MHDCSSVSNGTSDPTLSVDRCRQAIVAHALARGEELLDAVVSTILDELHEYRSGRSAGDIDDIRGGVRRSIKLCLTAISEGRGPTADELTAMRLTGGQRARQGIPRPVVLASVKIGTRVGRAFLMTCGEMADDPDVLMAAFRDITALLDRFEDEATVAMGTGYDEAYHDVLAGGDRGEAVLVDRLLESRFDDETEVLRHAAEVGLLPSRDAFVVVVATLEPADECRLRDAAARLRAHVPLAAGPTRPTNGLHLPLLVQPTRSNGDLSRVLERTARDTSTVLVWHDRPLSLTSVSSAYRETQLGLPYLAAATGHVGALSAVILRFHRVMFGGTAADRIQLLHDLLGPLSDLPEREATQLLETLDALYETGGSGAALARYLHLHKNTVGNRLRRVREVTGLDMRNPGERLVLETMLRLRRITDFELRLPDASDWAATQTA